MRIAVEISAEDCFAAAISAVRAAENFYGRGAYWLAVAEFENAARWVSRALSATEFRECGFRKTLRAHGDHVATRLLSATAAAGAAGSTVGRCVG